MKIPGKAKLKVWLRVVSLVVVLGAFTWYFVQNRDQFDVLAKVEPVKALLVALGWASVLLSNALTIRAVASNARSKISAVDTLKVTAYSTMINFFGFLQGGLGFRALYFKRYHNVSVKLYTGITVIFHLILFSLAGLAIVVGYWASLDIPMYPLLAFLIGVAGVSTAVVICCHRVVASVATRFMPGALREAIDIRLIFSLTAAAGLQLGGSAIVGWASLSAVGANISPGGLLLYIGVWQFSIVLAITPGAIGVREALLVLVQTQMMLTSAEIIIAATIDRILLFMVLVGVAPLAMAARGTLTAGSQELSSSPEGDADSYHRSFGQR